VECVLTRRGRWAAGGAVSKEYGLFCGQGHVSERIITGLDDRGLARGGLEGAGICSLRGAYWFGV